MENQVLVIVLKQDMKPNEILDLMSQVRKMDGVLIVKTFERIVQDALPVPE